MAVESKKQWWQWLFFSVIAVCGVIFSALAGFLGWIDAESGRYLLSAIIQSLAALLAIIFAAVVILWGQEGSAIKHLIELRYRMQYFLMEKNTMTKIKDTTIWVLNYFRFRWNKLTDKEKDEAKIGLKSILKLYCLDVESLGSEAGIGLIEDFKKLFNEPEGIKELETEILSSHDLMRFDQMESYWDVIRKVAGLYSLCPKTILKSNKNGIKTTHDYHHLMFLRALERRSDEAQTLISRIRHAHRARSWRFIVLACLYTITISLGLILLPLLRRGVCDWQATWISIGPLGLAIIVLAFTFIYLYYVVRGGKDA